MIRSLKALTDFVPTLARFLAAAGLLIGTASPVASSPSAVDPPSQRATSLTSGHVISQSLAPGGQDGFIVDLRAGQAITAVVRQRGVDVVLTVTDPSGHQQHRVDRPNGEWGREVITIVARLSGTYQLGVSTLYSAGPAGRYQLAITRVNEADADSHRRVDAEQEVTEAEVARATNTLEGCRRATQQFQRAASLWRELGEPYEEGVALYGLALSFRFLGEHEESLRVLQRMTALLRSRGGHAAVMADSGLAWTYLYLDDYEKAALHFRRALARRNSADRRGAAADMFGLAWTELVRRKPRAAAAMFRESLSLRRLTRDRRGEALCLVGLAAAFDRLDQSHEAVTAATQALEIQTTYSDQYGQAEALTVEGWALAHQGQPSAALDAFTHAAVIRRGLEDSAGEAVALHGQAAALLQMGESQQALERAERGLALVETVRARRTDRDLRTTYFASVQDLYALCVDLLVHRYQTSGDIDSGKQAFAISERARARSLLDSMGRRIALTRRTQIQGSDDTRGAAGSRDGNPEPLSVDEVQRGLDADSTMLVYATGSARSILWLIGQHEFDVYDLPPVAVIDRSVRRLLATVAVPPGDSSVQTRAVDSRRLATPALHEARALARLVLPEAVASRVRKRIVVVPSGPLQLIPFGILAPSRRAAHGASLLDDHELTRLPSASIMSGLRRTAWWDQPVKTLAVFADPVLHVTDPRVGETKGSSNRATGSVLPRLLGTRWEARAISRLIPAERRLVALDFQAARSTVQGVDLSKYSILHFGTHAIVDPNDPGRSGLVLSNVDERGAAVDGFIRAHEILQWPLEADLVVLSGCRTGVGRDVRGEGLMALSRGFLAAGASRLVMSLWSVDDNATAELMARFYDGMLGRNHLPPAAALRAAQLHMRTIGRWTSPYYWSGFILEGEWR